MSWQTAALSDISLFIRNGKSIQQGKDLDGLPITRIETIASQVIDTNRVGYAGLSEQQAEGYLLEQGDILFSHINSLDHLGKCAQYVGYPAKLVHGMNLLNIRPDPAMADCRYVLHALRAPEQRAKFLGIANKSVNQASISAGNLKKVQVPLPPLPEQRRIAAILDKADALRTKRREAIAKLDQLLQSVFLDMFGDPVTNPKGWHAQKSASLFRDKPRIGTTRPATGSGIVVVRVGEIGGDEIDFQRCSRAELEQDEVERYSLAPGDTVIARAIGSKEQLGKCSYFAGSSETVCIDSHVMRLRPHPERCDPLWFSFLLRSPSGKRLLQSKGGATAVQFNINTTQVSDLDVPLPPIELQRRFSNAFARVRVQKQLHSASGREFDHMFAAAQQQAFSGNL